MAKYTLRRLPEGQATSPKTLAGILTRVRGRLRATVAGPYQVTRDGVMFWQGRGRLKATNAVRRALKTGTRAVVAGVAGPRWAVKKVADQTKGKWPVPDTAGTRGVDRLYGAVHAEFDSRWLVRDMGICANKPLEHGHCNAWDAGTNMDAPANVQHQRITEMAEFLREEGFKHVQSGGKEGLPVNGVIVMDKYWRRGMARFQWAHYSGTPHVSHFHVSAHPSFTGFI